MGRIASCSPDRQETRRLFRLRTKISVREFLTGIGRTPTSPGADPVIGHESEGFAARRQVLAGAETWTWVAKTASRRPSFASRSRLS
jgi:hypothetical protein